MEQAPEKQVWRVRYLRPGGGSGSIAGSPARMAAQACAEHVGSDRRNGRWLDPGGAKTTVGAWSVRWVPTLDVYVRNYRAHLRNHILPRWQAARFGREQCIGGDHVAQAAPRIEGCRVHGAGATMVSWVVLDDIVDERLIPANPVYCDRRRVGAGITLVRRRAVWALPKQVIRLAEWAALFWRRLGWAIGDHGYVDRVPVGQLAGLQRDQLRLESTPRPRGASGRPGHRALQESGSDLWLGRRGL